MASLAQKERELIIERTWARLITAKQLGPIGSRLRKMNNSKFKSANRLLANGVPPKDLAKKLYL